MINGVWTRSSSAITIGVFASVVSVAVGVAVAQAPLVPIAGSIVAVGVVAGLTLRRLGLVSWWGSWLALTVVSAFGPFLDIVTRQPINWLIGMLVLILFVLRLAALVGRPKSDVSASTVQRWDVPILGSLLALWIAYYLLQVLRPDTDPWVSALAFRTPLMGFAAYVLTSVELRAVERNRQLDRIGQLLHLYVIVGIVVSAYGIFQFAVGFDQLHSWGLTDPNIGGWRGSVYVQWQHNLDGGTAIFRVFSTMRRNEALGSFLFLHLVACMMAFRLGVGRRPVVAVAMLLSFATLLLTFSLTNLLTTAIWVGLFVLFLPSRRVARASSWMMALLLVATIAADRILGGRIAARFDEHAIDTERGDGRVQIFFDWLEQLQSRSLWEGLFGTGICGGADTEVLGRIGGVLSQLGLRMDTGLENCLWNVFVHDNWYGTLSLEIGLIGLLPLWLMFAAGFLVARRLYAWGEPFRSAWIALALAMPALWPSGWVGAAVMYMPVFLYLCNLVAVLDVVTSRTPRIAQSPSTDGIAPVSAEAEP